MKRENTTQHEPFIRHLHDHGFKSGKFTASVKAALERFARAHPRTSEDQMWVDSDDVPELLDELKEFRRVPDAWYINEKEHTVLAVEVEHTHPLSNAALEDWSHIWWAFDSSGTWFFEMLTFDRYGQPHHVSLFDASLGHAAYPLDGAPQTIPENKCPETCALLRGIGLEKAYCLS